MTSLAMLVSLCAFTNTVNLKVNATVMTVTGENPAVELPVDVGVPLTLSYSYDSNTPDLDTDYSHTYGRYIVDAMRVQVQDLDFNHDGYKAIYINKGLSEFSSSFDKYYIGSKGFNSGALYQNIYVNYLLKSSPGGSVFVDDSLIVPNLDDFRVRTLAITFDHRLIPGVPSNYVTVNCRIDSITPEPSALLLLAMGLIFVRPKA